MYLDLNDTHFENIHLILKTSLHFSCHLENIPTLQAENIHSTFSITIWVGRYLIHTYLHTFYRPTITKFSKWDSPSIDPRHQTKFGPRENKTDWLARFERYLIAKNCHELPPWKIQAKQRTQESINHQTAANNSNHRPTRRVRTAVI